MYEHNDDEITTDMLVLHVTDGDFDDTKQLNIIIGLINDETPRVTINRGLRIKAGKHWWFKARQRYDIRIWPGGIWFYIYI